jgi:hypothetical protein
VLGGARLEVDPLSAASPSSSLTAVYCREGDVFLPLNDKGKIGGLVELTTGEIRNGMQGHFVAFEEWYITVNDDWLGRELILPAEAANASA